MPKIAWKMPKIPGICRIFDSPITLKAMPAYSAWPYTKVFMLLKRILPVPFLDRLIMYAMGLSPCQKLHP
jgi:hypothetical protein